MINLIKVSYWIALVLFVLLSAGIVLNFRSLRFSLSGITRKSLALLSVILLASLVLRIYAAPHRHWVFYDEYEHINAAKNMLDQHLFSRCDFYLDGHCYSSGITQWPPGYHFLLSLVFALFGASESVAYNFNIFLAFLSILLIFIAAYLATQRTPIALISALLLAFSPLHLRFSANSSLEMASFVFLLASFIALLFFERERTKQSLFMLAALCAYTILLRAENGIILVLFPLFLAMRRVKMRNFLSSVYLFVLFIPYFLYLPNIRRMLIIESLDNRLFESIQQRFIHNLSFFCNSFFNPLIFTLMAAVGCLFLFKDKKKVSVWFCFYMAVFFFIYTFIHKVSLASEDRYNLQFYFPLVIFAASGLYSCYIFMRKFIKKGWLIVMFLGVVVLSGYVGKFSHIYVKPNQDEGDFFQFQHDLFLEGKSFDDSYVFVTYNPCSMITSTGRSAVHVYYLFDDAIFDEYLKTRPLVLVDDYWCEKDRAGYCASIKRKYVLEKINTGVSDAVSFYLIKGIKEGACDAS